MSTHQDAQPVQAQTARSSGIVTTLPRLLLVLAILGYAAYFANLTLVRFAAFESRALDMGNMDQAIWNTMQGRWFHLTNQPGTVNRLSLHVEPILLPISLLYRVHAGPQTLLLLQAVVVALGALPIYALARRKLRGEWIALVFALAYLLNPSIQAANWLEFHPVTLAPAFLLATLYFLFAGRTGWYALFAVLAISCKEEIGLLVFMIGLYAFLALHRRRLGSFTMIGSLIWSLFAVFFVQDYFAAGNIHWDRYAYLGETPLQMLTTLITQPGLLLAQLQSADALTYLAKLLLPVGFTAIFGLEVLALALPSLAINLLADFPPMHQVDTLIYAAPIVPFVLAAGVIGVQRLIDWTVRRRGSQSQPFAQATWSALILASLAISQLLYGYIPGGGNFRTFAVTDHHRRAAAIIEAIPPNARVAAQDRLNPHISGRETVYIYPRVEDADTVFVDVTGPAWPQHPSDLKNSIDELLAGDFGIAAADDGYLLLSKQATEKALPDAFFSAWRPDDAMESSYALEFGDALRLVDHAVETDAHGELVVKLFWQAMRPLDEDFDFYVGYRDVDGNTLHDSEFYPPVASLWYPTSLWTPGERVLVQTLPWRLENDRFSLVAGVYSGEAGWHDGRRLPITQEDSRFPLLEGNTMVRLGGYRQNDDGTWKTIPLVETAPENVLDVQFGDAITLEGSSATQDELKPGDPLDFTLHWRASQPPAFDYAVFAHLLNAKGEKVAQLDWQPRDAVGLLPATSWPTGHPVVDSQSLALPESLPPGDYRLIVGLYNWQDGVRVAADGENVEPDNVVTVAVVRVE